MKTKEVRSRTKRKIPKWQKCLTKAERKHLKEVHAKTRKSFADMNNIHNMRRKEKGVAIEPCFTCKSIALKMGLEVFVRGKLVEVRRDGEPDKPPPLTLEQIQSFGRSLRTKEPATLAKPMYEDEAGKPVSPFTIEDYRLIEPIVFPVAYWIILGIIVGWGVSTAIAFLLGW